MTRIDPAMHKREILMEDGRRYMIFFTFDKSVPVQAPPSQRQMPGAEPIPRV